MEYQRFDGGYVLRLDPGDEVVECLTHLAREEEITLASVTGLGAAKDVTVGLFSVSEKKFYGKHCEGEYEIASLTGNITQKDGQPYLHLHICFGNPAAGEVYAGHLTSCVISATAEIFVQVWNGEVGRGFSSEIGLNLLSFRKEGRQRKLS